MTVLSWTVPLRRPEDEATPAGLTREGVWRSMRHKAEAPAAFVPYIAECTVLESTDEGMVREIRYSAETRGGGSIRERVVYEPEHGRMTFLPDGDPDVTEIVNEVGEDGEGGFAFTLRGTLSRAADRKALSEPEFLPGISRLFAESLRTIVAATVEEHADAA
ncbi:hypothetical protein C0216_32900 (plasmid) [Streptomyces globosus]|uniref:DUF1857 domain-containing protein n=1 Tax=Streptomyces globosus TaxID=68209 RepID=A0A344UBK1_9ACTN|nr:AtaL-like protein [Streptomyces globosus]AXE28272.1 hypothetical protein C0216_32900 [Streptomyces globosus]